MAFDYVISMDVGTYFHHACVLDPKEPNSFPHASIKTKQNYATSSQDTSTDITQCWLWTTNPTTSAGSQCPWPKTPALPCVIFQA